MLRLPWSPLGCVTALLAVLDICQAHNPKDNPEYYVFRGDSRGPQEIRDTGGFLPDPDATSYSNPTTFSLDNHVNGRTGSSAYVATSAQFGQAARNFAGPGNYVYRIHVTPNMINVNEALTSGHPYPRQEEASALGGIPWTAVEGWLQLDEDREFETSSEYLDDGSADRFTARYVAEFADQFELNRAYDDSGLGGPARQTRADPQVALLAAQPPNQERLLNAATAFMNSHASAIGWTENQAFPYSPPSPPQSTEPLALQDVDVSTIPDAEREDLTEGRFDSLNCLALAVTLGTALLQTKGPNSKRYLPRAASVLLKSRDDKKGSGVQILHPCKKIKNIEFGLNLANEYWGLGGEGTWDDIGGILEGKAGKAEFKIAEQPALGSSWWTPVKFPSDTIDITGIDKLSLTAEPHLWRWAQRDWFKVKVMMTSTTTER
ncbi:Heat-labile enterotoxin IIA, A chain [Metarhizium guizhouense ARSEF 977]|uniref:Heat-labile enterotoxin IIA, A chain n=1 Tax=Metarhizium guizhouense (strain ARSEF 977) TaxID=1276136 RepID=A0A0B4GF37_METGA|nr:Heat-labile enterotoxin IIA, A chain [Metarhizium guizhouense ARSEF 977]